MSKKAKLIMMRHGESEWNRLNLFTGWVDIPLSAKGIQESIDGGKKIAHIPIDIIFTSTLVRAQTTVFLAMSQHKSGKVPLFMHPNEGKMESWAQIYNEESKKMCIPVYAAWELNERMYGKLQGMNKQEMRNKFGDDQVKIWRRSYDVAPPEGESLAMNAERTLPYFKEKIIPHLEAGKNVFISAHGNSQRAIVMFLDNLNKEQVVNLEIPTGEPMIYDFSHGKWKKETIL